MFMTIFNLIKEQVTVKKYVDRMEQVSESFRICQEKKTDALNRLRNVSEENADELDQALEARILLEIQDSMQAGYQLNERMFRNAAPFQSVKSYFKEPEFLEDRRLRRIYKRFTFEQQLELCTPMMEYAAFVIRIASKAAFYSGFTLAANVLEFIDADYKENKQYTMVLHGLIWSMLSEFRSLLK